MKGFFQKFRNIIDTVLQDLIIGCTAGFISTYLTHRTHVR